MAKKASSRPSKKLRHEPGVYAKRYRASLRTIRRWKAAGCPLDDPSAMREFLARNKPGRPVVSTPSRPSRERVREQDEAAPDESGPAPDATERGGIEAEIERMRAASLQAHADYQAARKKRPADTTEIRNRLAEWSSITEQLRKLEKDWPGIQRENDKVLDADETAFVFQTGINNLARALDVLPHRLASRLVGLSANEIFEVATAEATRMKRVLNSPEIADLTGLETAWRARQEGKPIVETAEEEARKVARIAAALDAEEQSDAAKRKRRAKAKKYPPGDYRYRANDEEEDAE